MNVAPASSVLYLGDYRTSDAKLRSQIFCCLASIGAAINFVRLFVGQLGMAVSLTSGVAIKANAMLDVSFWGRVLKVVGRRVLAISINMVDVMSKRPRSDKGLSDQVMNQKNSPLVRHPKIDDQVAIGCNSQDLFPSVNAPDPARFGNLVVGAPGDCFPFHSRKLTDLRRQCNGRAASYTGAEEYD